VTVAEAVALYVVKKRESGRDYRKVSQVLNSFAAAVGNIDLRELRPRHVSHFLNRRQNLPAVWYHKYMRIRGLLRYWVAHGEIERLALPRRRASRPTAFYPFIFSRNEIKRLLLKAPRAVDTPSCVIGPETMKNIVIFLYATGLNVGDAIRIKVDDLDLQNSTVKIAGVSGRQDRIVPLGEHGKHIVARQLKLANSSLTLFATKHGSRLSHRTLSVTFRRLCNIARVYRQKESVYQPRLHDLRHTFAVHRIGMWCRDRRLTRKMLPLLAAYMGMITVTAMEKYLLLAPSNYISQMRQVG
jgi:integrase/recombinase XerD